MPKEKTTTRKARAAKADTGGKKKKGATLMRLLAESANSVDPNAPKRGLSAYMFFANEQRDKVREENPNIKFGKCQCSSNPLSTMLMRLKVRSERFLVNDGRP